MAIDKLLQAEGLSIDEQLNELKAKQKQIGGIFDIQIKQLELQKNANKAKQNDFSLSEKEAKLKEEIVRAALEANNPVMPGTIDQLIPVEPEAQGAPLIKQEF